jgi:hypothetical protein
MLATKFGGEGWKKDFDKETGYVFINKDGLVFEHILNVLRGYQYPTLTEHEEEVFRNHLEYYGLTEQVAKGRNTTL